jgi:putative heme iron utilization protein
VLAGQGRAYVSLVAVATDVDGAPLLLLSGLSDHTRNLGAEPQVSLLFDGTGGFANPQEGPRATVMGLAEPAGSGDLERVRRRYLGRHPGAALYAGFADFAFHRVAVERIHWVGGFGRAAWIERLQPIDPAISSAFAEAELGLLDRLGPGASRVARAWLGRRSIGWRFTAVDPDGFILAQGKRTFRLNFASPLTDPAQVEAAVAKPPA